MTKRKAIVAIAVVAPPALVTIDPQNEPTNLAIIAHEIETLEMERDLSWDGDPDAQAADIANFLRLSSALDKLRQASTYLPAKSMDDARFQLKLIAFYVLVDGDTEKLFEAIGRLEESVSTFLEPDAMAA